MKKTTFNLILMTAVVLGLSCSVTSCKDDDDDKNTEQRNADADPLDTDEAETAWRWLSVLTSTEMLTNDWNKKTYEPTVGVPSENNANTRIVVVTSLDEAKMKFASMTGVNTNQLDGQYTAKQSGVGSLVWTPSKTGAQNLAEVTVDTKLIPKLQKIVYCTEDQMGVNAKNVVGTAFYRLGDVVEDKDGYYWVCVRPSFEQGDKGKSHWINIYNASATGKSVTKGVMMPMLPENIYDKYDNKEKYNNRTIVLPTKLKFSREHIYNLVNLIWALIDPSDYAKKVGTSEELHNNGLCGFDYKYHGEKFLQTVAFYWDKKTDNGYTVWELLFNRTHEEMNEMNNICFLYKGYQWRTGRWGYLWKYDASWDDRYKAYSGDEDGDKEKTEFADKGFDVRRYCSTPGADQSNAESVNQFSKVRGTWVVRYKTGADLMANGAYSPYEKLNGCKEIFHYNTVTNKQAHDALEVEGNISVPGEAMDAPKVGCLIGADGKFYANKTMADRCKINPVAMVVYLGGDTRVQEGRDWNGLAIALKDAEINGEKKIAWNSENANKVCCSTSVTLASCASLRLDGFYRTIELKDHSCDKDHKHPAAEVAWGASPAPGCSVWFLPSIGQWFLASKGMGYKYDFESDATYGKLVKEGKWLFKEAGVPEAELSSNAGYWSTTEKDGRLVWEFNKEAGALYKDIGTALVRQMTAFTYGNGASKDPESTIRPLTEPVVKSLIGRDGQFYSNKNDAVNYTGYYPVAVVAYMGDKGTVETGTQYRGLAISLQSPAKQSWIDKEANQICTMKTDSLFQSYEGLKWTKFLSEGCGSLKHIHHPSSCYNNDYGLSKAIRENKGFSNWFIPTTAQWLLIFEKGLGMKWNKDKKTFDNEPRENYNRIMTLYPTGIDIPKGYIWTVSEQDEKNCYVVYIDSDNVTIYHGYPKVNSASTVPMIAF